MSLRRTDLMTRERERPFGGMVLHNGGSFPLRRVTSTNCGSEIRFRVIAINECPLRQPPFDSSTAAMSACPIGLFTPRFKPSERPEGRDC